MSRIRHRLESWLGERLPLPALREFMKRQAGKPLPPHTSWLHTFGSLSLFLLVNQIVTGILLMVYYRPTTEHAFESIEFISVKAAFGWLIRGLHAWGSTLMILMLLFHMARTFFMGAFKKPRELTWVTGVAIFGVTITFGFTGYLLPWNQVSYWATTVGTEIAASIPLVGQFLKELLLGGDAVSQETLQRFYVMHVIVLPWIMVGLVFVHFALIRTQGLATMDAVGSEPKNPPSGWLPFFPNHVLKELTVFAVFLACLISVVILFPPELGEKADAFTTPVGIKPEWYFLPSYQLLKFFPELLGIAVAFLPPLLLLVWPFLDRTPERRPGKRPISVTIGIVAILAAVLLGLMGYVSEQEMNIFGTPYRFDAHGIPARMESR